MRYILMDNLEWDVIDYKNISGQSLVEDFLDELPAKSAKKIVDSINLLERFGPRWGQPNIDYFKAYDLYELRVKYSSNIYRIFFFRWKETILILTHGFTKKSQKTSKRQLERAAR